MAACTAAKLVVDSTGLVALSAENMKATDRRHFVVFYVRLRFVARKSLGPLIGGNGVLVAVVIKNGSLAVFLRPLNLALRHAQLLRNSLLDHLLLGHELGIAAEQNVGAAARHIGGDRDHALASGLGNDLSFALMEFRVQHNMLDAFFLQQVRQSLRLLYRSRAHQHWLAFDGKLLNFIGSREIFFFLRAVHHVGILDAQHLLVRRNHHHFELVNLVELGGFGLGRTGHSREFLEHAEIVLKGDRRQRLILALDLDAFLGFDRLMKAIGPAAPGHHTARVFIDDDHLTVFDHIFNVFAI